MRYRPLPLVALIPLGLAAAAPSPAGAAVASASARACRVPLVSVTAGGRTSCVRLPGGLAGPSGAVAAARQTAAAAQRSAAGRRVAERMRPLRTRLARADQRRRTLDESVTWDRCPAPDGALAGHAEYSLAVTTGARSRRVGSIGSVVTSSTFARLRARVGADARVARYDLVAETRVHVTYFEILAGSRAAVRSRRTYETRTVRRGLSLGARVAVLLGRSAPGPALRRAQARWYDAMGCARLTLTPSSHSAHPGERVASAATLSAADGRAARGTYAVTAGPADARSGALPADVVATVPEQRGGTTTTTVVATSPAGRASASFAIAVRERDLPRFAISVVGQQRYDWRYEGVSDVSPGTDSACLTHSNGSGVETIDFATRPGGEPLGTLLPDGTFAVGGGSGFATLFGRTGSLTASMRGVPVDCAGTRSEDAWGCATDVPMHDLSPDWEWRDGRLFLKLGDERRPELGPCPLRTADYGQPLGNELLDAHWDAPLSLEQLRDPSQREIVLRSTPFLVGHEDCAAADGPGCTNDAHLRQTYAVDTFKTLEVTVVLRRL